MAEPRRCSLPAMFIRQPRSPASRVSAPLARMKSALAVTILLEISGYFTQKVPPKPQQTSASVISVSSTPGMDCSRRRGCAFTPSSRRPEQESWRSEEHTSELQSLMRISYAVFCLKQKKTHTRTAPKMTYKQEKEQHKVISRTN